VKIRTGLVVGEIFALLGTGHVDAAPLAHFSINEKNAGTVGFYLEGVFPLNVSAANFPITDVEMACYAVNICCGDKKSRARETITAEARAIITKYAVNRTFNTLFHMLT